MNTSAFPQTTLPMPLWLQGLVELGLKALGSYLTVLLLLLAIWYTRGAPDHEHPPRGRLRGS